MQQHTIMAITVIVIIIRVIPTPSPITNIEPLNPFARLIGALKVLVIVDACMVAENWN